MSRPFVKHYPSLAARQAAEANYRWLAELEGKVRLPELIAASGPVLRFERVDGRCARPQDLVMLAAHLGHVHSSAHAAELHQARLDRPYQTLRGHVLPSFPHRRVDAVARELRAGNVPGNELMSVVRAQRLLAGADGVPSTSGHKNRGLPKTTSPENPWSFAEDRGFEPRMVLPPNRISSAAP
jgi:hypothetical protein